MNTDKIEDILKEVSEKHILPYFKTLRDDQVQSKSHKDDLVTIADQEAEENLTAILKNEFPDTLVIGEESVQDDPSLMNLFETSDKPIWIIDPVDGTFNFRHGSKHFGIILALAQNNEAVEGWIYDILGGRMMRTQKGAGTTINDRSITLGQPKNVDAANGLISRKYFAKTYQPELDRIENAIKSMDTYGCAAHDYLSILEGQKDFVIYCKSKPWDHVAGVLAVNEAVGYGRLWSGDTYTPVDNKKEGLLIASSEQLWSYMTSDFDLAVA